MTSEAAPQAELKTKDPVASIARRIPRLSTGDRARLRRIYLTKSEQADGVVVGLLYDAGVVVPVDPERFAAWRLLAHVAALLSGTGGQTPHAPNRRLGAALHAAGYSENRLLRLTAARGPALHAQIVRAARVLAQAGAAAVDLWPFFDLSSVGSDRAEAARLRIAQDYYGAAQPRVQGGDPK